MSFAVEDVFVSAIPSVACTVLVEIGEDYKRPHADVRDLYSWAERFRRGVVETADERTGAARDYDLRAKKRIATETVAQFSPLLCGGLPHDRERALLKWPRLAGGDVAVLVVLRSSGWAERSSNLRREGLRQASDGTFAEYCEPFTGEPLGSATVLDRGGGAGLVGLAERARGPVRPIGPWAQGLSPASHVRLH